MDYGKNEKDMICTDPNCPIAKPHCHMPRGGDGTDTARRDGEKQDENR